MPKLFATLSNDSGVAAQMISRGKISIYFSAISYDTKNARFPVHLNVSIKYILASTSGGGGMRKRDGEGVWY